YINFFSPLQLWRSFIIILLRDKPYGAEGIATQPRSPWSGASTLRGCFSHPEPQRGDIGAAEPPAHHPNS
ncbi:MAG TPA: hypothetical protein PKG76_18100, partial [Acidobacteriota bacterium]|nr:hypothetical protein [Acidobacteriota bacterium]